MSEQGLLQPQGAIDDSKLPAEGAKSVSLRVTRYRPSATSRSTYSSAESGTLRVDLKQTEPLPQLQEALAWTAIAALLPDSVGKLPALTKLSMDPGTRWGTLQTIPVTNGLAFWSWNFFMKPKKTAWDRFMEFFRDVNENVVPLVGLPGLTVTALAALDRLFGYLQAQTQSTWIFKSLDMPVYTTLKGKALIGTGLPLKTGNYVLVPSTKLSALGKIAENTKLYDGWLVPKNTKDFDAPDAGMDLLPDIDYVTVYVKVDS